MVALSMAPAADAGHRGRLVNVAMWITLAPMCIAAIVKLYTKWALMKRLQGDDALMVIALLFAVAQSVATSEQVHFGLGQHQNATTNVNLDNFFLTRYVGQLLYFLTIYTSKTIGLWYFLNLTIDPRKWRTTIYSLLAFILVWMVIGIFVICFQCSPPRPWLLFGGHCINENAFWTVNVIVDISTQVIVGLLPVFLLKGLQTSMSKKLVAMFAWTPNLLVIPVTIVRLCFLYSTPQSADYTWESFNLALTTSLHAILSVMTAAIPFSKQFIDSLVSMPHFIGDETTTNAAYRSHSGRGGTRLKKPSTTGSSSLSPAGSHKPLESSLSMRPKESVGRNIISVYGGGEEEHEMEDYATRDGSQDRMVIYQTRSVGVSSNLVK